MATTFTHSHAGFNNAASPSIAPVQAVKQQGNVAKFVHDLVEDLGQKPLQAAKFAKHDMFREHINAMSISYFALIVLLVAASVPLLAFLVPMLTQ